MSTYVETLLEEYKAKGVLIDANLLLLYLVGSYDLKLIGDGKYNKLSKYAVEDYRLLVRLISVFKRAVTTAHVLTELSNLTADLPSTTRAECFKTFCNTLVDVIELVVPSFAAAQRSEFPFMGLTDCCLAEVSGRYLVVTDDARLVKKLNESDLVALNFNHLRTHLWI